MKPTPFAALARSLHVVIKLEAHTMFCRCGASVRAEDVTFSSASVNVVCPDCSRKLIVIRDADDDAE